MLPNRPLDPSRQYQIDDFGRIRPIHQMGWTKERWKNAASPEAALVDIAVAPVVMADIFPPSDWSGLTPEEWTEMRAKRYLDIEDGFYLATGVNVGYGTFRFEWGNEVFFNMRPDFGFLSITTDLGEEPINPVESAVRDRLIDYYIQTGALRSAIDAGEIELPGLYTLDWWLAFWELRGLPVQGAGGSAPVTETPEQRRERLKVRVREEKAKGTKAFMQVVAKEEGISPSRLKQLVAAESAPAAPGGMWTGLLPAAKSTGLKKRKT